METIMALYKSLLEHTSLSFKRYIYDEIDWESHLVMVLGARGVGKTTMLLQRILLSGQSGQSLYIDVDHTYFTSHSLYDTADTFYRNGGKFLYIDEIHKYSGWSKELKMICDYLPGLHVVATGSSILAIKKGIESDLSRRAIQYELSGMSFREFLEFRHALRVPVHSLEDILANKITLPREVAFPLVLWKEYLREGYFPFASQDNFYLRLNNVVNQTLEQDIPQYAHLTATTIHKLKKLLHIVASSVPFKPNYSELGNAIGADRALVADYLTYMEKSGLTRNLSIEGNGMNLLEKLDKIYLANTCFLYALAGENVEIGTVRETVFLALLSVKHKVHASPISDFVVNGHTFEVGGRSKKKKQIKSVENAFVVKDDIETGFQNILPLWAFGLLY